jgi:hypothetical protein
MGVLSQQNLPLNLSNCKNQDITYEGNCLTDVQTQITALLNGSGSQAPFTMNVPAQFPDTQIPTAALQCRGINGCVTQLQALNDQVNQAKTTLTTGREAYETQARQSTDQFTQQVAALLNNQSAQLRKQLTSINTNLQGLGVSGNIGFPNVQGKQMEYETNADGSQGLPKMPSDVMALISGKMSPPMMDLTDNSNNDGSALAGGVKKVNDSLQKVQTVRSAWEALATTCAKADKKAAIAADVKSLSNCINIISAYKKSIVVNSDGSPANPNVNFSSNSIITDLVTTVSLAADDSGGQLSQKDQNTLITDQTSVLNSLLSGASYGGSTKGDQPVGTTGENCSKFYSGDAGSQDRPDSHKGQQSTGSQNSNGPPDAGNANGNGLGNGI